MSDRSDYSDASQFSEDDSSSRSPANEDVDDLGNLDDDTEDDSSEAGTGGSDDDHQEQTSEEVDFSKLKLCPEHNPGEMLESCPNCSAALSLITDKKKVEELSLKMPTGAGLLARYEGRCDSVPTTLHLSSDTVKFAHKVFTQGVWKDSRLFKETIKRFLLLPPEQHDLLSADIQCEESLNQFKRDYRFKSIFKYQSDLSNGLRQLRISQRPLFSLQERVFTDIQKARALGKEAGIVYPDLAPVKEGDQVPRNGRVIRDQLHYSSHHVFSKPDLSDFARANNLPADAANELFSIVESYRIEYGEKYIKLYDLLAAILNVAEDQILFYMDMYSHSDATLRDLIRDQVASLFKKDIKVEVMDQSSSKRLKDEASTGILGGVSPQRIYFYFSENFYIFRR